MDNKKLYLKVRKSLLGTGGIFDARKACFDLERKAVKDYQEIKKKCKKEEKPLKADWMPREYFHLFKGVVPTITVPWDLADNCEDLQEEAFAFLNEGIIELKDIPKIPEEKENKSLVKFYGFDTEDDSKGFPHFYQFATRDRVYISHSFRLLLKFLIDEYSLQSKSHICWGTNIEYELGNIMKDWIAKESHSELIWSRGGIKKLQFNYILPEEEEEETWVDEETRDGSIKLWDTMTHWKCSVAYMGNRISDLIGFEFNKLESDFYSLKYAAMDAIISRSYASIQNYYYNTKGIQLKFTPGATALFFYMNGHAENGDLLCKHKLYNTHKDHELDWLKGALRGGRTEVFSLKEHHGKIGYYDINSAYPFAMKFGVFPHPKKHYWENRPKVIDAYINVGYEAVVDCIVHTDNVCEFCKQIPYLGVKDEETQRLVFPLGTFRGKYTAFEIRKAKELGYEFEFIDALLYEPSRHQPFKDFVDIAYSIREEGARLNDKMLKDIGKSIANNLFGKFSQERKFAKFIENYETDKKGAITKLGTGAIVEVNEGYASHTNYVWSCYITAMCRDQLFHHMMESVAAGNEVLYCDTDSIFITGGDAPPSDSVKLGALKHEADFSLFQAVLPKVYHFVYDDGREGYKSKGVPSSFQKKFFHDGRVDIQKPLNFREALRRTTHKDKNVLAGSMSSINFWGMTEKKLKSDYTKRLVNKDLSTSPLVLEYKG